MEITSEQIQERQLNLQKEFLKLVGVNWSQTQLDNYYFSKLAEFELKIEGVNEQQKYTQHKNK